MKHGFKTARSRQKWVMPKMNYYEQPDASEVLPGLWEKGSLELVALDLNYYDSQIQCTWIACTSTACKPKELAANWDRECPKDNATGAYSRTKTFGGSARGKSCNDLVNSPVDGTNDLKCDMAQCRRVMAKRAEQAAYLLRDRVARAQRDGATLLVFSHYPAMDDPCNPHPHLSPLTSHPTPSPLPLALTLSPSPTLQL